MWYELCYATIVAAAGALLFTNLELVVVLLIFFLFCFFDHFVSFFIFASPFSVLSLYLYPPDRSIFLSLSFSSFPCSFPLFFLDSLRTMLLYTDYYGYGFAGGNGYGGPGPEFYEDYYNYPDYYDYSTSHSRGRTNDGQGGRVRKTNTSGGGSNQNSNSKSANKSQAASS